MPARASKAFTPGAAGAVAVGRAAVAVACGLVSILAWAGAAGGTPALNTVTVTAKRVELSPDPRALPAAVTVLTPADLARTPISSYGDIFRTVPGLNVSNYGQGGIGYGLSLRGFTNAEHGRDIAYFIDGVPVNEVSSIHTRNYADLNILVPETVERIDVIRGPFDVEYGDSNLGGAVNIVTRRSGSSKLGVSGGSYDTFRGFGAYGGPGSTTGAPIPFLALEVYDTQGYRDNSNYKRYNSFNKLTLPFAGGTLAVRAQFYGGLWGAPGYISRDAVRSGTLSDRTATDPTDGGNKHLQDLVLNYDSGLPLQAFSATVFASHDVFTRWANFSPEPVVSCPPVVGCGQREQLEERTTLGGKVRKVWTAVAGGVLPVELLLGGNYRADLVDATQYPTVNRQRRSADVVDLAYAEQGAGAFAQLQVRPLAWVKLTAGARYDRFFYDVHNHLDPGNSPRVNTGVWSPKAGITLVALKGVELYANYGEGFRSPSVVDDLLSNPALAPLKLKSREAGIHITAVPHTSLLLDVWGTDIDNESFQAAPGLPEQNIGRSRRTGFDVEGRYTPWSEGAGSVALFSSLGTVTPHLIDQGPGAVYVPNVPVYVAQIGTDFDFGVGRGQRLGGQLRADFTGHQNLSEDGGQRTPPYARVTGRINYGFAAGWTAYSEATWYPRDRLSEFAINFGPLTGAASTDIFVAPVPAFAFVLGLSHHF